MPYLLLASFTNDEGNVLWRAFTSTDENRSDWRLRRDTFYEIGYQESHPSDKYTVFGILGNYYILSCDIPSEHRSEGIQFVATPDNGLNDEFALLTSIESYAQSIPEGNTIIVAGHTFVDPNPIYTALSDSDTDSD
jgi:hypothetical protein